MPLAILIITAAVISSLFRALTPWAKQYKTEIEQHLSTLLGEPVSIRTMETGWYWFEPVIKLNQVAVLDGTKTVIKLNKLFVGINLFSSLWHWQIQPGVLFIDDLHLSLHQTAQGWQVDGVTNKQNMAMDAASLKPVLSWVLAQQKIIIKELSAHVYLLDGSVIPLDDLKFTIANRSGRYRIKGEAHLNQAIPTKFELLADLRLDSEHLNWASGQAFFSVQDLLPNQWQKFFPQSRLKLNGGRGDIQLWTDFKKGKFANVQGIFHFHHLSFTDGNLKKDQFIQSLKANLAWNPTKDGWQLSGDHIGLRLAGTSWPENSLLIRYQEDKQDYFIYVKNILLQSLFDSAVAWPGVIDFFQNSTATEGCFLAAALESSYTDIYTAALCPVSAANSEKGLLNNVLTSKPHGELHDTQLKLNGSGLHYVLTRFAHLGWLPNNSRPGVENLDGVLHWQPNEGRLEIDSNNTVLVPEKQTPITFSMINAVIDWKELENGLRVSMDRIILSHTSLLLSAQGVADDVSLNSLGSLRLHAQFSAKNAEKWLPYLPSKRLKPKLNAWLKNDVKHIDKATGELIINGNMADFPFDKQQGIFSIRSYLSGVDLNFAPKWPMTRDIEAYLNVDKRTLEANIVHANLQDVIVEKGNLQVSDLGLDKEVLLVHAKAETQAKKALAYVNLSPLKKKLSTLNMLQMQGPIELDLQVEVPLYPENDEVLALGNIDFKNNNVKVHHSLDDVELNNLNGNLQFDERSILGSNLKANLLGNPVSLLIKSIRTPTPSTEVRIKGQTDISVLRDKFKLPIFSLMHGSLWLESLLILTDEPRDLDHLQVQTSLRGLAIDLPSPLGKMADDTTPLTVNLDFNAKKGVRLRFDYNNRLSSDLWFSAVKGTFELQKGKIILGNPNITEYTEYEQRHGLQIVGSLSDFDLQQWLKVKEKISKNTEQKELTDLVNFVDIKLQVAKIFNQSYKDLSIKAEKLEKGEWSIRLHQENIAANLRYHPASNTLRGLVEKLHLQQQETNLLRDGSIAKLKPADMPNLDLQIASLELGDLEVGEVAIKTTALKNEWQINDCKIKSPSYQLSARGGWQKDGKVSTTKLQADLHITNLAKSLEEWNVSPVVAADRGEVQFRGGWSGPIYHFSLAKLNGEMGISLKDGRITNLSPETEEKLGLGKLLSILSLQTIPRRLKLDFSDLSEDGYSFDEFNGNFSIANGVMTTQDSYIDGPVAYASMKGNLDIAKQYYDLDLKVNPHITASLPVVATIAGGPIAGIATWVASKLINHGMQKISGYTYKITGPWKQPVVQQVKIIKKRKV
ncbi:transmembrane protein [Legionella lansingensis]|uniref:Transmembrane protein n=2 Tax=Legionella lansingensis TaxID=45067 RepID=A0A0W0VXQ9_9GAMM|nr:YhdP family protein [Legionella lansingensis]KTD24761.1 transmembrane protein [Legionella lansingensis]SNV48843.1 transmembrane protein [Legionella lansingensis]